MSAGKRRSILRWGFVISAILHLGALAGLGAWSTQTLRRRPQFIGEEQPIRLVARVESQWSTKDLATTIEPHNAGVVIQPSRARIAKRTYVLSGSSDAAATPALEAAPSSAEPWSAARREHLPERVATLADAAVLPRKVTHKLTARPSAQVPLSSLGTADTIPPDLSRNPPPTYPELAIRRGWEGTVYLRIVVDPMGAVRDVQVIRSSGHPILDAAAANAVRSWTAQPAQRAGLPVTTVETLPVQFKLH